MKIIQTRPIPRFDLLSPKVSQMTNEKRIPFFDIASSKRTISLIILPHRYKRYYSRDFSPKNIVPPIIQYRIGSNCFYVSMSSWQVVCFDYLLGNNLLSFDGDVCPKLMKIATTRQRKMACSWRWNDIRNTSLSLFQWYHLGYDVRNFWSPTWHRVLCCLDLCHTSHWI